MREAAGGRDGGRLGWRVLGVAGAAGGLGLRGQPKRGFEESREENFSSRGHHHPRSDGLRPGPEAGTHIAQRPTRQPAHSCSPCFAAHCVCRGVITGHPTR